MCFKFLPKLICLEKTVLTPEIYSIMIRCEKQTQIGYIFTRDA